ncbi:MAG: N-acetylneuraminate synthase family protein, partial [Planctomycetes bacterium]|nr:N-acetylneuraminate synthase family protein [Planctomycetota bacterium]
MTQQDGSSTRVVNIGGVPIGGPDGLVLMAGPCAVESREQMEKVARFMACHGIPIIRGGAFKPRTSPYAFQGLGEAGLEILRQVADRYDLQVVSEVMDTAQLDAVTRHAHLIQVGARGMTNTCLLKALGNSGLPVLLKRGFCSTLDEFLMAAEHIRNAGNAD